MNTGDVVIFPNPKLMGFVVVCSVCCARKTIDGKDVVRSCARFDKNGLYVACNKCGAEIHFTVK